MKNINIIGVALCLLSITRATPVLKISEQLADNVNDLSPIAIEAQELPVEQIDNVQMNVGKMLERSLARFSLDELVHGLKESVDQSMKPILDRLGHFRLAELLKHIKNKPILSHVVGDERPTTIEVVVHKPNGHTETIFTIPHKKKFLDKFKKPFFGEEPHPEEETEEHVIEDVVEPVVPEIDLKPVVPVIDFTSHVYQAPQTPYKKPVDIKGRRVADADEYTYDEIEEALFKALSRQRRDTTNINYPEDVDKIWAQEDPKDPHEHNELTDDQKKPTKPLPGKEDLTLEQALTASGLVPEKDTPKPQHEGTKGVEEHKETEGVEGHKGTEGHKETVGTTPTGPKKPLKPGKPGKRPEKFVVTVEEHPHTSEEHATFGPEEDPNEEYQDEFTAQELMQFAYKWLRKNVVFRV